MLFNSLDFAIFLPLVFLIYWFVFNKNLRLQNAFLVVASYVFYGWWDWRFLILIAISTIVDFTAGLVMAKSTDQKRRKLLLWVSILANLGLLGFFKYFNFFIDNFTSAFSFFGAEISSGTLNIVLPVGISFYTFQTMSYAIDIYKRKLEPINDIVSFAAFVGFFPQLMAGPIERASNLLPQLTTNRRFDSKKAKDGLRQILWGLFKKVVIADTCGFYVNLIFNSSNDYSGSTLVLGAVLFSFQIYGDFSGYSDIAIGTARLFGIDLMRNFAYPFFSRDIAEFWRRWHISLSSWFRDYLYIPLGGSRGSTLMKVRNIFLIFIIAGFWHGANWTFVVWGTLHAIYFLPLLLLKRNRKHLDVVAAGKNLPTWNETIGMVTTFGLTTIARIFFRADSVGHAFDYVSSIFSLSLFSIPEFLPIPIFVLIVIFLFLEWLGREQSFAIAHLDLNFIRPVRWAFYYVLIMGIFYFGGRAQEFIYFQF